MKDFSIPTDNVFVTTERDLIVQQIDMLFDTIQGEVFGEIDYGSDFYQFIWDLGASNEDINQYVEDLIQTQVNLFGWELSVETNVLAGTENDIILISITLTKNLEKIEKTYRVD